MPAIPTRRRHRFTSPLFGAVLALGLVAGCTGQRAPDDYGAKVERAFVDGCTKVAEEDAKAAAEDPQITPIDDPESFCECAYDRLSDENDGIPFSEFKEANDELTEDPGKLPEPIAEAFASCRQPG